MDKILLWVSMLCLIGMVEVTTANEVDLATKTMCLPQDNTGLTMRINCGQGELLWIIRAYNGRVSNPTADFCAYPYSDLEQDCVQNEYLRSIEVIRECNKRWSCNFYMTYYSLDSCGANYTGEPYLAVEHTCHSYEFADSSTAFHYFNMEVTYGLSTGNRALLNSQLYPQWRAQARGACQITVPPDSYVVFKIMDFRGRLIGAVDGCPIELVFHDGTNYTTLCGQKTWNYMNITMTPSLPGNHRVDVMYQTLGLDNEGRVEMIIEGRTAAGGYVDSMNVSCGKNKDIFTTTPPPTPSTTTATTTAAITTTTTLTSTTTATPTTTTTVRVTSRPSASTQPETTDQTQTITETPGVTTQNLEPITEVSSGLSTSQIIVGGAIAGAVLLAIIIAGTVFGCTKCAHNKSQRRAAANSLGFENPVTVSKPRPSKKQNHDKNRQHNPYILNNRQDAARNSNEFYDTIADDETDSRRGYNWHHDNRNIKHGKSFTNNAFDPPMDYDSAFDQPTESTLKMAQGTTRGFNY